MTFIGSVHASPGDCNIDRKHIFNVVDSYKQTIVAYIPHKKLLENLDKLKDDKSGWLPYLAAMVLGFIPNGKIASAAFGIYTKLNYDTAIKIAKEQLQLSKDTGKCGVASITTVDLSPWRDDIDIVDKVRYYSQEKAPPLCLFTHTCKK